LQVEVKLKSSDIREKLHVLDKAQRATQDQLNNEVTKHEALMAKAEKLQIVKLQSQKNLSEINRRIRLIYVTGICLIDKMELFLCIMMILVFELSLKLTNSKILTNFHIICTLDQQHVIYALEVYN